MKQQPSIEEVKSKMDLVKNQITELKSEKWEEDDNLRIKMIESYKLMLLKGAQWLKENEVKSITTK